MRILLRLALLSSAMISAGISAGSASATVVLFTDQVAFNAAVTGATTSGFSGFAPIGGIVVTSPTVSGVTFTDASIPFVIDAGATPVYGVPFFSGQNASDTAPNNVGISLSGYNAFGFVYGSYISANDSYVATLNTGDVFNFSTASNPGTTSFLGFISDGAPITQIDLVGTVIGTGANGFGYAFDITQFTIANPAQRAVPEPATWAMMLAGFGLIGGAMRRKARLRVTYA